jgi:hypothetical protein
MIQKRRAVQGNPAGVACPRRSAKTGKEFDSRAIRRVPIANYDRYWHALPRRQFVDPPVRRGHRAGNRTDDEIFVRNG